VVVVEEVVLAGLKVEQGAVAETVRDGDLRGWVGEIVAGEDFCGLEGFEVGGGGGVDAVAGSDGAVAEKRMSQSLLSGW